MDLKNKIFEIQKLISLNKNKILDIKNYLSNPSNTEILYNSKKFTKNLENIFQNLMKI